MTKTDRTIEDRCISTIRPLSIDAVEKAASGHASMLLYSLLFLTWYDMTLTTDVTFSGNVAGRFEAANGRLPRRAG